jgi:hypothetical protein
MAWAAGTSEGKSRGGGIIFDGEGFLPAGAGGRTTTQTKLARRLSPPKRPSGWASTILLTGFIVAVVFGGFAALLASSIWEDTPAGLLAIAGALVWFFLMVPTLVLAYHTHHHADARKRARWEQIIALWRRCWVCLRCGSWFEP